MDNKPKLVVAVIRGGPSSEHDVSLSTGLNIINNLPRDKYEVRDIRIAKDGVWHIAGQSRSPENALKGVDVVWNALHGEYGEDGRIQHILETFGIPYTGADVVGSSIAMNKDAAKKIASKLGIKTARYVVIRKDENVGAAIHDAFKKLHPPFVVKPLALGSSVGVSLARDFHALERAVRSALEHSESALVEEYVKGVEATCGVIEDFRGERTYTLLPIEIRPPADKDLFDYEAKYSGISEEICPGNFSPEDMKEIQRLSAAAHEGLGLRHYSRSDFIVSPKRGIYFLETNTLPGFTSESLFPKALRAVGSDVPEFIEHIIALALRRN